MKINVFLDTNVFIYGFEFLSSNSARILQLLNEEKIVGHVNHQVLKEVSRYFACHYSAGDANLFVKYLLESCTLVDAADYEEEWKSLANKINPKDRGQIAAVKALGLKYLISYDRDFKPFSEYRTPKKFLHEIGEKPSEAEY